MEIDDKAAAVDSLKKMGWDTIIPQIIVNYRAQTREEIRKEAMIRMIEDGWEAMTVDEMLLDAIAGAIVGAAVETGVNELADYGLLAASLGAYYTMHGVNAIGQGIQLDTLQDMLAQSNRGDTLVKIEYFFMPKP